MIILLFFETDIEFWSFVVMSFSALMSSPVENLVSEEDDSASECVTHLFGLDTVLSAFLRCHSRFWTNSKFEK